MRNNKSNKGFTLIELLIVIAIIGILAAVLIPNLLNARTRAVHTGAEAYARNCATAVVNYSLENPADNMSGVECVTAGASAHPDYVTAAAVNTAGDAVVVQYTVGGSNESISIPVDF